MDGRADRTVRWRTAKEKLNLNCARNTAQETEWIEYRPDGTVSNRVLNPLAVSATIFPGTVNAILLRIVCAGSAKLAGTAR
jgi:hypothetical protein